MVLSFVLWLRDFLFFIFYFSQRYEMVVGLIILWKRFVKYFPCYSVLSVLSDVI